MIKKIKVNQLKKGDIFILHEKYIIDNEITMLGLDIPLNELNFFERFNKNKNPIVRVFKENKKSNTNYKKLYFYETEFVSLNQDMEVFILKLK